MKLGLIPLARLELRQVPKTELKQKVLLELQCSVCREHSIKETEAVQEVKFDALLGAKFEKYSICSGCLKPVSAHIFRDRGYRNRWTRRVKGTKR